MKQNANGFRQSKVKSKKELQKEVQNLQMAVRVMQMGFQQFASSMQAMQNDLTGAMGIINDLQYRTLAMIEDDKFDKDTLNEVAERLKLKDFNEASDKENEKNKYTVAEVVAEDSVVTLTSTCEEDPDKGIFRTKFKLDEAANPEATQKLVGLKVGETAELTIAGTKHVVEVLDVRQVPEPTDETSEEEVQLSVATQQ